MTFVSLTTTAREGNIRHSARLSNLLRSRHWPVHIATAQQVHGGRVQVVPSLAVPKEYPKTDGLLTSELRQPLGIFTADCLPIFLCDEVAGVVGVLHAGWRGVRAGILEKSLKILRRKWKSRPKNVQYWMGPSIGPCCFEVRWDVARYFPKTRRRQGDRWNIDLAKEIHVQANRLGLRRRRHARLPCTMHDRRFFSYRRNQTTDRQVSIIIRTS